MTNIVMLVRNRHRLTEQALRSLYQNTPREEFTLTLVDDASDDFRVKDMLNAIAQHANATLVRVEKSSHVLARAKNLGVFWSRQQFGAGEWLYLSDNDVWFSPGWLAKLIDRATDTEKYGVVLFGGQVHPFHQPLPLTTANAMQFGEYGWTEHQMLDGPSWLMRWSTWRSVGELNPRGAAGTCKGEDVEWCQALVAKGGRIGVIHPHVVAHTGLTNTSGEDAPGRAEREGARVPGVLYE